MHGTPVHCRIGLGELPAPTHRDDLTDDAVAGVNTASTATNDPLAFPELMSHVHAALEPESRYAIGGALAYGLYGPAHATRDINIYIHPDDLGRARDRFRDRGIRFRKCGNRWRARDASRWVALDLMAASRDPAISGITTARRHSLFGQSVPVFAPEFVLWTMLAGYGWDYSQGRVWCSRFLQQGHTDPYVLACYLVHAGDHECMKKLAIWGSDREDWKQREQPRDRARRVEYLVDQRRRDLGMAPLKPTIRERVAAGEVDLPEFSPGPSIDEIRFFRYLGVSPGRLRLRPLRDPLIRT